MKKILFLIGLVALVGAGCVKNNPNDTSILTTASSRSSTTNVNQETGTISGALSYPAEGLPPDLKVCALNTTTNALYCTTKPIYNDPSYSLTLPSGTYTVYAQSGTLKGYYSEFVTCGGYSQKCPSHKNIEVNVITGSNLTNIDPGDWYAPDNNTTPLIIKTPL